MNKLMLAAILFAVAAVRAADPPMPPPGPIAVGDVVEVPRPEAVKPLEFKSEVGVLLRLGMPATGADLARWVLIDGTNADIETCENGKKCTFAARAEGRYRLIVSVGTKDYHIAVTVGKPVPPDVPPAPVDPLYARLQAAYTADAASTKVAQLAQLAALYDAGIDLLNGDTPPATTSELIGRLHDAAVNLKVSGLEEIRRIIAAELKAKLPAGRALTGELLTTATATFSRIRDALQKVK